MFSFDPLKTSENQGFSDVFKGGQKEILGRKGLKQSWDVNWGRMINPFTSERAIWLNWSEYEKVQDLGYNHLIFFAEHKVTNI